MMDGELINKWMDGQINRWIDGWMDEYMDE